MQQWLKNLLINFYQSRQVQDQLEKWKTELFAWGKVQVQVIIDAIEAQFIKWLPIFLKAIIAGVAQAAGQLTINTTDKVTDWIPGKVDDAIIDPLVSDALDTLGRVTGLKFH